ncbi:MAG: YMGG-like glycine zipper-containing protein [Ferruginibacter sp.]
MKKILFVIVIAAGLVACKSKSATDSETKNLLLLPDTPKLNNSYLTDTGKVSAANMRSGSEGVNSNTVTRNTTGTHTSHTANSSSSSNTSTSSSGSTAPAAAPAKKGWSKAAKGATIGGVGGAVAGAVIGHNAKGAVIGGVLGATGGYIIGRSKDKKDGRVKH